MKQCAQYTTNNEQTELRAMHTKQTNELNKEQVNEINETISNQDNK